MPTLPPRQTRRLPAKLTCSETQWFLDTQNIAFTHGHPGSHPFLFEMRGALLELCSASWIQAPANDPAIRECGDEPRVNAPGRAADPLKLVVNRRADTVARPTLTSLELLTVDYGEYNVKKALVCGAGGFIARHLTRALKGARSAGAHATSLRENRMAGLAGRRESDGNQADLRMDRAPSESGSAVTRSLWSAFPWIPSL